ncbi:RNA polymerase sigma factor SigV [Thalassoglobus neptunius]|uniref:RNA polymerase sigma factor SigV n=1 Tax=Thalassoglobus neptunius TaxID=1938619 RepID=A0A5C5X735_9PLAN|nr:RNA polymerase sigma factor [Thalassoglobus neptunius]TWT58073.1 RNA polymerase sigma factor SigV [Thalassoglobus neptunius]
MDDQDQQLVFINWLEDHSASVMKVARAYTLNSEDCQDLAQEILLQAWRSVPKFSGKSTAATWFYRVALNTAMNWKRKDKPRRESQQPLIDINVPEPHGPDSSERLLHQEMIENLYQAIHQLPKTDAALVLLYLDELSYQEMAEVLGVTENSIGVKLNRAKKKLATILNGGCDES